MGDSRFRRVREIAEGMGLKMGKDIGVVGLYNTPWAELWDMTSISVREDELARLTVQATIEKWKNKKIVIEPTLVIRRST